MSVLTHRFAPGDEHRPWRTYSQLWQEHRYTRGALDKLVMAGRVPFCDGETLLRFLIWGFEAAVVPARERGRWGNPLEDAVEAAARLGGDLEAFLASEATRLGIERGQPYYDMQEFIAFDAADRLSGGTLPGSLEHTQALGSSRDGRGVTALTTKLWTCPKCNAEVPETPEVVTTHRDLSGVNRYVRTPANSQCPVCAATAIQLELLKATPSKKPR